MKIHCTRAAARLLPASCLTIAALFILAFSSAPPAKAEDAAAGGTLTVGMSESFKGFNPYQEIGRQGYNVVANIFDTLTTYGVDYVPQPMLAKSWEQPDAKSWRFFLRNDVVFHDGTPFNAEAAKFSIERIKESNQGKNLKRVAEVKVVDEFTIDLILSEPFPTLPAVLTQQYASMVPPTAYQKAGADEFAKKPIGSGPFKFESQDSSGSVTLVRNERYWRKDGKGASYPYLDKVALHVVPDRQTAALSLQAGDVDFDYEVPIAFVETLRADPNITISETPSLGLNLVFLHAGQEPFDNAHKRRAVSLAIDRKAIVETVLLGDGVAALGPIAPRSWAYDPAIESTGFYGYVANVAKAKEELAAAGTPQGFKFKMVYPAEDPFTGIAQAIKAQLGEIGIAVELEGKDFGGVLDDLDASKFQALMIDWSGRIDEDLSFATFFRINGSNNAGKYSNPKVDELIKEAAKTSNIDDRKKLYREAQKIVIEDLPDLWINYPTDRKAMRNTVHGYENFGDYRMRFFNVWKKG